MARTAHSWYSRYSSSLALLAALGGCALDATHKSAQPPASGQALRAAGERSTEFKLPTEPTGAGGAVADSCIWFTTDDGIQQVQTSTHQVTRVIAFKNPQRLIMNAADCGVWALDKKERTMTRFGADGMLERQINVRALDPKVNEAEQLRLDPYDDSLWITDNQRIIHLTADGQVIANVSTPGRVQRLQVALDRTLWVLGKRDLWRYDAKGALLASYPLAGHFSGDALYFEIDSLAGLIWLADNRSIAQLNLASPTKPALRIALERNITGMALDPHTGHVWVAQQEALLAYTRGGALAYSVDLESKDLRKPEKLAFDPVSRSLWVGSERSVSRFTDAGVPVVRYAAKDGDEALGAPAFKLEPTLTLLRPSPNALTNSAQPLFTLSYGAACNGAPCTLPNDYFAGYQLAATLNGAAVGTQFQFDSAAGQATFTPAARLPEGANTFSAQARNSMGIMSNMVTNAFTVDTVPPRFVTVTPVDGAAIPTAQVVLQGSVDDPRATVVLDGTGLNQTGANFSFPVTLQPGANVFTLSAIDLAGNRTSIARTLMRASLSINIASPSAGASMSGSNVLVSGTIEGASNAGVTVNGVPAAMVGNQFHATVPLQPGVNELIARASTLEGASVQQSITVTSTGPAAVEVTADSVNGVAPFDVSFTVSGVATLQRIQADFDGNGTTDFTTTNPAVPITYTFSQPGVYAARFVVSTLVNGVPSDITLTVPIIVIDPAALDQQLRATWQGFAGALVGRDKAKAMQYLTTSAQQRYGRVFDTLLASLPVIAGSVSAPLKSQHSASVAEYVVTRPMSDGSSRDFLIYFVRDSDGNWRLESM